MLTITTAQSIAMGLAVAAPALREGILRAGLLG